MADTFTVFLKETEPKDREQSIESYLKARLQSLDRAVAGYTTKSLHGLSGNVDLSPTEAKHRRIVLTGNPAAAVTVRVPHSTGASCDLIFVNACGGSFSGVTFKSTGANGGNPAGVPLATGYTRVVAHNGESAYPVTGEILSLVSTLNSGIVAFWKLDEASGTRYDAVRTNHLTDNNTVTQATGKVGNAASFASASSEYLSCADNADLSTGDVDFMGAGWFQLMTKTASMDLVAKWGASGNFEYILTYDQATDRFIFFVSNNGTTTASVIANTFGSPSIGTWYFVVFYHDATGNLIGISVNNGAFNTTAHTTGVFNSTAPFQIGARAVSPSYFNGRADAVGFWKRLLSAAEITELYNAGAGREYPF
ncbi:MAG TPA: LamG-like jellyroll fold domain-containing protein [Pyrinomonadaceae bacterium]|nr:LamG-like jellyroll fold domain-containing protein [Pyrinomonadaceae bacterium]